MKRTIAFSLIAAVAMMCLPATSLACACGCNVFSVGGRWLMATSTGYRVSLLYDYMNQYNNWSGWNPASSDLNGDKQIRSSFTTLGFEYMASREWGVMVEAPVWDRYFKSTDEQGYQVSADHISVADVRVTGMYTGLSDDMSTALLFGLKLPTGPFNLSLLDRDTQIGTGTTDLLFGGYQMGQESGWGWYAQALWQHAFNSRDGYRPGDSFDVNVGVHYDQLLQAYSVVPMLQLIASFRGIDGGPNADPANTGYQRLYVTPGLQINLSGTMKLYGDLRIPVLTKVRGQQLVAPSLLSLTLSLDV
jgi:hypothetical protein